MTAYGAPYIALFNGILARLRAADGPFAKDDQVKAWADEALDELEPSAELVKQLSRGIPIALVCDVSNYPQDATSDGTDDEQTISVWFCANGPDLETALLGDGTQYWGALAIKHYVVARLLDRTWGVDGWELTRWDGTQSIAIVKDGKTVYRARFKATRLQKH